MPDIHFNSIKIDGYRGRHFELVMKPPGQNTVFVMDGNTGKTTTIALLRWCFNYSQSEAEGKFHHMWARDAHTLNWKIRGSQKATISISFTSGKHDYTFRRTTYGEFIWESKEENVGKDIIEKIEDVLEIDKGKNVEEGDEAHEFLRMNFRLHECADYFCFDGEQARKFLHLASDPSQIKMLIQTVDKRISHPKLSHFKEKLEGLESRVYHEVKKATTSTTASETTITRTLNEITKCKYQIAEQRIKIDGLNINISSIETSLSKLESEIEDLRQHIEESKSDKLLKKTRIESDIKKMKVKIEDERRDLYKNPEWLTKDLVDFINNLKSHVKEKGKLPEPYREELIKECLSSVPKTCHICGRKLDSESESHVRNMGKLVASHNVQEFLTSSFKMEIKSFDPKSKIQEIKKLIKNLGNLYDDLGRVQLSDPEKKIVEDKNMLIFDKIQLEEQLINAKAELKDATEILNYLEDDLKILQTKSKKLEEFKIIFDKINETLNIIEKTEQKIKEKTREIISETISRSVTSILGPKFSARLTSKHLLLGEDGKYHPEIGGMSGRLILSYCFAEAMTLIDPIIIDTPSGNIGGVRKELAEHLKANHQQVILLCLPTELEKFAPIISSETIPIESVEVSKNA